MNYFFKPAFLVGVLSWTAFFFIGPSPLGNIPRAWAQQCIPFNQPCPRGYQSVTIPPNTYFGCYSGGHVCVVPQQQAYPYPPGQNVPFCVQYPDAPGCPGR